MTIFPSHFCEKKWDNISSFSSSAVNKEKLVFKASWWQLTHEGWSSRAFRGRFWSLLQMMKPPIVLIPKASKTSKAKRKGTKASKAEPQLCKRHFMLRRRNARKTSTSLKWCRIDKHLSKNFYPHSPSMTILAFNGHKLTQTGLNLSLHIGAWQ